MKPERREMRRGRREEENSNGNGIYGGPAESH